MAANEAEAGQLARWRFNGIGLLRILFGIVWGIDAWFKWQPDFVNNFKDYLSSAQQGQPWPVHHWIGFWVNTVGIDPTVFAYLVAVAETAIAIALILGVFMNLTSVIGVLLTIVIWSTAEGFGGPYQAGSTDIGAAIIYALVFAGLYLSSAGLYYGLDRGSHRSWGSWVSWRPAGSSVAGRPRRPASLPPPDGSPQSMRPGRLPGRTELAWMHAGPNSQGKTVVLVAVDGRAAGLLAIADAPGRPRSGRWRRSARRASMW